MSQASSNLSQSQIRTLEGLYVYLTGVSAYLEAHASCVLPEDEPYTRHLLEFAVFCLDKLVADFPEVAAFAQRGNAICPGCAQTIGTRESVADEHGNRWHLACWVDFERGPK